MQQFESISQLKSFLTVSHIEEIAVQSVDLTEIEALMLNIRFSKCLFLGCTMSDELLHHLLPDNFIFPVLDVPFNTYPNRLYDKDLLYNGFNRHKPETYLQTLDKIVYDYCTRTKENLSIKDTLAQRLHDHSITDSLHEYISRYNERKLVAIMQAETHRCHVFANRTAIETAYRIGLPDALGRRTRRYGSHTRRRVDGGKKR